MILIFYCVLFIFIVSSFGSMYGLREFTNLEKNRAHKIENVSIVDKLLSLLRSFKSKLVVGYKTDVNNSLHFARFRNRFEREKFIILQSIIVCLGVAVAGYSYVHYRGAVAVIAVTASGFCALVLPIILLRITDKKLEEELDLDISHFAELIRFGVVSGVDIESNIDCAAETISNVSLPKSCLKEELALFTGERRIFDICEKLPNKLKIESSQRIFRALKGALREKDKRGEYLKNMCNEVREDTVRRLDNNISSLPSKTFVLTLLLLISCFAVATAPVAVKVKELIEQRF